MSDSSKNRLSGRKRQVIEFGRRSFVTGATIMIPLLLTVIILGIIVEFFSQQLDPVVTIVTAATSIDPVSPPALKIVTVSVLVVLIFVIGIITELQPDHSEVGASLETFIAHLPGVGMLYRSINEMSTLLLDTDAESFRDVKLVEFPDKECYSLAFVTAETPSVVETAAGHNEMVTLFLPMAPNPVTGGHVLHVPADRVMDVDISVEESIQTVMTSGVVTGQHESIDVDGRHVDLVEADDRDS